MRERRLNAVDGGLTDQVPRLERFRAEHPEWLIVLDGFWKARRADAEDWTVIRYELRDLLDKLEEVKP